MPRKARVSGLVAEKALVVAVAGGGEERSPENGVVGWVLKPLGAAGLGLEEEPISRALASTSAIR